MNKYIKSYLERKNITDENIGSILNMKKEDVPSALLMKGSQKFIDRIIELIEENARIVILGDYDADGVSGTIVAVRSLRLISKLLTGKPGKISYFIPDRFNDGYGISKQVIDKIKASNPKAEVIITVDNGIVGFDAVDYAKQQGFEVIITDHHQSLKTVPNAEIVVNPNQVGDTYPFKGISGTAVVYKLFLELSKQHFPDNVDEFESLIDFVGVSTVADVMPMQYENRYYVKSALDIFNGVGESRLRFGWNAMRERLITTKRTQRDKLTSETDFGFLYAPIINAQSRVNGKANIGVDTFLSLQTDDIREKVEYMVNINEERKNTSNNAFHNANLVDYTGNDSIIIVDKTLGEGYIGLISGKMTEKYNRPSIVFTESEPGILKGSARSIDNVNILEVLRKGSDLTLSLGGHEGAAGMLIEESKLDEFSKIVNSEFKKVIPKDLTRMLVPDITIDANELDINLLQEFEEFGPFGPEFEFPLFEIDNLPIDEVKRLGKEKNHLKLTCDGFDIICWNGVHTFYDEALESGQVDVVGRPQINEFMNKKTVQIIVSESGLKLY